MALNNMGFGFVFTARDMASGQLDRLSSRFRSLDDTTTESAARIERNLQRVKRGAVAMTAGAVGLAGAFAVAQPAGEFEHGLARVGAISRASADEMKELEEAATAAGLATKFSPQEATEGLANFAAQGLAASQSTKALVPALDLATGGQISVAESAQAMTSAIKVFGLEADDAAVAADKLLRISNTTSLQSKDLALALGAVGRGAGLAKQSLDETLVSMGLVKNTGVDASVAASSVSSALIFMAKKADDFRKLGVSITDTTGEFRPFVDIIMDTKTALGDVGNAAERTAIAQKLFGRFGVSAFQAVSTQITKGIQTSSGEILRGRDAIEYLRTSMADAGGTAAKFKGRMLDTFKGQQQLLGGIAQTFLIEIGKPFAQILKPVVETLADLLLGLINLVKSVPGPLKKALAGLFVGASALLLVGGAIAVVSGAIGALLPMLSFVWVAFLPVIVVVAKVAAVVALIGAAIYGLTRILNTEFSSIAGFFSRMWNKVKLFFQGLVQLFRDGGFSGAVLREMDKAENAGIQQFVISLYRIGHRIVSFWKGIWGAFTEAVAPVVSEVQEAFRELWEELEGVFNELMGALGELFGGFADMQGSGETARTFGAVVGAALGAVVRVMVKLTTWLVRRFAVFARVIKHTIGFFREFTAEARSMAQNVAASFWWIWGETQSIFGKIGTFISSIVDPIAAAFDAVVETIKQALVAIQDMLIETVRQIPDWALPESLVEFGRQQTSQERQEAARMAERQRTAFATLPAAVQARVTAETAAAMSPNEIFGEILEAVQQRGDEDAQPIVLQIDGEKVAEAVSRGRARGAARSFDPVSVAP